MFEGFHHVAVFVRDVETVTKFYRSLGLDEVRRFFRPDGSLRSVWVGTGSSEQFFAIEEHHPAARAELGFGMVALRISAARRSELLTQLTQAKIPIEKQTGWTIYVRDPEGNLVGFSHYPEELPTGAPR